MDYRFEGSQGDWEACTISDGLLDSHSEEFTCGLADLDEGIYIVNLLSSYTKGNGK